MFYYSCPKPQVYFNSFTTLQRAQRHSSAHPSSGSHISPSILTGETGSRRRGRPTTALPYVTPNLPTLQQFLGSEYEDEHERLSDDRLVWVDALNKWVPENQVRFET